MSVSLINTLGGDSGFGENTLPQNDDGSTGQIDLNGVFENGLNFFGETYTSLFINNNGGVSFANSVSTYTPQTISSGTTPGIFPYWADVDTRGGSGNVSPGGASQGSNLLYYTLDTSNDRLVVTWDDVGYFSSQTNKVNAFQLIMSDASSISGRAAGDFDIEFRYEWVDWTAGRASGGTDGVGGVTSRAGYSAGNGIFFELPQAGNEDAMLALESTPGNTGEDGLWRWSVFNGAVPPTVSISSAPDVIEGNTGIMSMVFQVERTGDVTGTMDVEWSAAGFFPSAANSADVDGLLPRGGSLTFAEGETVQTITIGIRGDTVIEPDENIVVTLSNAVSSTGETVSYAARQGFGEIINDDFPPPPGSGPRSDIYGDPHVQTLDGLGYDFQAVGEFTLIESVSGDPLNVQARMTAVSDVVSFITAVATEIDGTRIMLDATRDVPLSINGALVTLNTGNSPLTVAGTEVQIYANEGTYTIIMPNGEQLMVGVYEGASGGYLNICNFLAEDRAAGSVRGLLGNADGIGANDLALPDGTVLPQPVDFDTLYSTYADAWRITEAEALFDRAAGETTADYQDSNYPRGLITIEDLPADIRAAAEAAVTAAGITDPVIAANAVLDYALTGDPSFITSATTLAATPTSTAVPANIPAALPTLLISSQSSQAEGDGGTSVFRFDVARIVSTEGALDVNYTIGGQVDAADLDGPMNGTVSFADGEVQKTIEVVVKGDTDIENDEALTVSINASGSSVLYASNTSTTVVLDDDGMPVQFGTNAGEALEGDAADNALYALGGDDTLTGNEGSDILDGGIGTDTAVFTGAQTSYTLTLTPNGTTLLDRRSDGSDVDQLVDIELLDFGTNLAEGPLDLQKFGGPAGLSQSDFESFIELYIAYFDRAPDAVGLNFWGTAFANGTSLEASATLFIDQDETRETYPSTLSNTDFATEVYANVLGRMADQAGFDFWVGVLEDGSVGRDQFILAVLGGAKAPPPEGATPAFITQQQADQVFLETKTDLGAYFAVHKGMSDVDNASAAMTIFDGTQSSLASAISAIDGYHQDALSASSGEFLMPLVGVLDDPFTVA